LELDPEGPEMSPETLWETVVAWVVAHPKTTIAVVGGLIVAAFIL
jgi:hypothetical protein